MPLLRVCQECSHEFLTNPAYLARRPTSCKYCSRDCLYKGLRRNPTRSLGKDGYIIVRQKREHRSIMEAHLKRNLSRSEYVHHINGNKSDNRIENLTVLTASEHAKLHAADNLYCQKRGVYKKCPNCLDTFYRVRSMQHSIYCGMKCYWDFERKKREKNGRGH